MEKEKDLELLEAYLNGELTKEEAALVKSRLETDQGFQDLSTDYTLLTKGIEQAGRKAILDKFETWENELTDPLSQQTSEKEIPNWGVWRTAAAVILIAAASFLIWYTTPAQQNKRLFNEYFSTYSNVVVPISRADEELNPLQQAFFYYETEDFQKAIDAFDNLIQDKDVGYLYFYKGVSLMAEGEYAAALEDFSSALNSENEFSFQSQWYSALCNLASGDISSALKFLKPLSSGTSSYAEKSAELMKRLE